jgi:predicted ATP-binding protein involved in virulence
MDVVKPRLRYLKTMQIKQISVNGLFGIFDHVIPLNMDERITIVHGPNGFGKTAMLRILNGFFNSKYSVLRKIPFDVFRIEMSNKSHIEIVKIFNTQNKSGSKKQVTFNFHINGKTETHSLKMTGIPSELNFPIEMLDDMIPGLRRMNNRTWRYAPTNEILSLEDVVDRFEDNINIFEGEFTDSNKTNKEPEWLKVLKNDIDIRLIESQRLLNVESANSAKVYSRSASTMSTVVSYSNELAHLMQNKFTEYGVIAQTLDETFPRRLVNQIVPSSLTDEEIRNQLDELEKTRSRLMEVGLLDKIGNSDLLIKPQDTINASDRNVLSVYVEDTEKKLNVFDVIARKLGLLRKIVNNKFAYSYKDISFDKKNGFVFKTLHENSSNHETLSPTDLSSGEQHELILLYELLFKAKSNSLVLIDEPELSLHVGWQVQFLKDLQEITKLADLDILMATHSPDLIQDRWDLSVELKRPEA